MSNPVDSPFVAPSIYLPEDDEQRIIRTQDVLNELATAVNLRDIATYSTSETVTGQSWLATSDSLENEVPFRKLVAFSSLTAPGTTTVAHGISNIIICTRIYGVALNSIATPTTFIPLPQSAPDDISIVVNQTNVVLTAATATYSGYNALVVLEYFRQ